METPDFATGDGKLMRTLDVLIPHYNDPDGLILSLRSVLCQTWCGRVRIVIADDGSSKDVKDAIQVIAEFFRQSISGSSIELTLSETNRGRPYTRNVLLDSIQSDYVAWLDAGDEWYPEKLSAQFKLLGTTETATGAGLTWITCNYDWRWVGGKKRLIRQRTRQDQHKALLMGASLRAYLWTLLGPAEAFRSVGYFDERLPRMQDLDYFIRFVSHGGVILNVDSDKPFCVYHKSDLGRDAHEIRACNALIYDKHRVIFQRYGEKFCKMRLYKMDMLAARFAQNNGENDVARRYMLRAFRNRPFAFVNHLKQNGFKA